jgi:hypothetical protein
MTQIIDEVQAVLLPPVVMAIPLGVVEFASSTPVRLEEAVAPALEYNSARRLRVCGGDDEVGAALTPCSATALRVLAILTGMWIAQSDARCRSDFGKHMEGCRHQDGSITFSLRSLARDTFGHDGGSAVAQAARALAELGSPTCQVIIPDPPQVVAGIGVYAGPSCDSADDRRGAAAACRWTWAPALTEQLLAGRYQRLPVELVRDLTGSAFRLWVAILSSPATSRLLPGQTIEFAVTGDSPTVPLARLGLSGLNRPAKVRAALERSCDQGHALQNEFRAAVVDRSSGGVKVRVTRVIHRIDSTASDRGRSRVMVRTSVRQSADEPTLDSGIGDGFVDEGEDLGHESVEKPPSTSRLQGWEPQISESEATGTDALAEIVSSQAAHAGGGLDRELVERRSTSDVTRRADAIERVLLDSSLAWKPASSRQRRRIEGVEERGIRAGCRVEDHLAVVTEGIDRYVAHFENRPRDDFFEGDPLGDLFAHDVMSHPQRAVPAADASARSETPDIMLSAWEYASRDPITPQVEAELRRIAAHPAVAEQGGELAVANVLAEVSNAPAEVVLDRARRLLEFLLEPADALA